MNEHTTARAAAKFGLTGSFIIDAQYSCRETNVQYLNVNEESLDTKQFMTDSQLGIGVELDLGAIRQITPSSRISMSVVVSLQGTLLRVRWVRPALQIDLPIILSRDIRQWKVVIAAYTVPPLLICLLRYFVVRPIMRRIKDQEVPSGMTASHYSSLPYLTTQQML